MTSRVETVQGESKKEIYSTLNKRFGHYQIVDESVQRKGWTFWKKMHEVKVLIETKPIMQEAPVVNKQGKKDASKPKNRDMSHRERDTKKEKLLQMLNEPEGKESSMSQGSSLSAGQSNEELSELKKMVKALLEKVEEEPKDVRKLPLPLEKMETYLKEQEVEEQAAKVYVDRAAKKLEDKEVIKEEEVFAEMVKILSKEINTTGALSPSEHKVIALVGPTGVGKTTTLAKIGWELHKKGRSVGFITTDSFRSGAREQLTNIAEKMESETMFAKTPNKLREAMNYFQSTKVDHILIDTVGRNPLLEESIESVKEYLDIANPSLTSLVLSSTSKTKDLTEILKRFEDVSVDAMTFTKIDETYNVGSLINIFNYTKLPLMFATNGQDVTKNIYAPSAKMLAEKVLKKDKKIYGDVIK